MCICKLNNPDENRKIKIEIYITVMNAVIAMCTFCEMHGPKVIFSTQTYRKFDEKEPKKKQHFYGPQELINSNSNNINNKTTILPTNNCDGCENFGNIKYLSNEHESRTSFISSRQPLAEDIANLLSHACIRSLSCELHLGKNGVCYFGDENRGHVLSHFFTLKDAQARGIRRSCSFIVFMKDKQFLLNMWPFFVDNLNQIIQELQEFAERKYNADEAINPQRSARLSTANDGRICSRETGGGMPRGLSEITNEKHVFVRIHMWLVWILSTGAKHFTESYPKNELLMIHQDFIDSPEFINISKIKTSVTILRELSCKLTIEKFRKMLYACLTGTQMVVRGTDNKKIEILYALSSLVPRSCRRIIINSSEFRNINECNFLGVDTSVAVPVSCQDICRLDIIPEQNDKKNFKTHVLKWTGQLPSKLPTLLVKLEKYIFNNKLDDSVLKAQFIALQEEWANIAKIVHSMRGRGHRGDLGGLIISLGAGKHDLKLLDSWSLGLPSNPA